MRRILILCCGESAAACVAVEGPRADAKRQRPGSKRTRPSTLTSLRPTRKKSTRIRDSLNGNTTRTARVSYLVFETDSRTTMTLTEAVQFDEGAGGGRIYQQRLPPG